IFDGQSLFGPIISTGTGKTLDASDAYAVSGADVSIGAGSSVGLAHVLFSGLVANPVPVSFNPDPLVTNLADKVANVPINGFESGLISPTTTSVPEPSTIALGSVLVVISGASCLVRRFRPRTS